MWKCPQKQEIQRIRLNNFRQQKMKQLEGYTHSMRITQMKSYGSAKEHKIVGCGWYLNFYHMLNVISAYVTTYVPTITPQRRYPSTNSKMISEGPNQLLNLTPGTQIVLRLCSRASNGVENYDLRVRYHCYNRSEQTTTVRPRVVCWSVFGAWPWFDIFLVEYWIIFWIT